MFTVGSMSDLILQNEKYIILLYIIEIFWKHGGPEKKIGHEKVTRPCIPPHGFFKEELGLSSINSSQKTSNCEEKNPWGGIHDLVTFSCPNFFFGAPYSKNLQHSICLFDFIKKD